MRADGELPADTKLRSSKYLNDAIEQDHRECEVPDRSHARVQGFNTAAITIAGIGIELLLRIRKGQFDLGRLRLRDRRAPTAVWGAVLAAQ